MNVSAAAESNLLAIPCRRWDEDTKMRGIPRGVGRGIGWQNRPALKSTGIKEVGCSGECARRRARLLSSEEATAIAVEIRCAIRQPAIFSRAEPFVFGERRKRYALDASRIDGVSGGEDKAMLMVSNRILS